jgi:hypothetical protein
MNLWDALELKWNELGPLIHRRFWHPLHRIMEIFHVLPLTAAIIVFVLLAITPQLREIYVSYLEVPKSNPIGSAVGFLAAAAGCAMISAVLFEAHLQLSTMRINVIYSSFSNPDAGSKLHSIQRTAGAGLALMPWLGLVVGLLGARNYLAGRYYYLLCQVQVPLGDFQNMQKYLLVPRAWVIALTALTLGAAIAFFLDRYRESRFVQGAVACTAVPAAAMIFLLVTDSFPNDPWAIRALVASAIAGLIAMIYIYCYYRLYTMRSRLVYSQRLSSDTGINLRARRRLFLGLWTMLPWLAVALYFATLASPPAGISKTVCSKLSSPDAFQLFPATSRWAAFPVAICLVAAVGIFTAAALDLCREKSALLRSIIISVLALAVAIIVVSLLEYFGRISPYSVVAIYQWIGPVGSMALVLLFLISIFAVLAALSQRSGFPALTLVVLAIVVSVLLPVRIEMTVLGLSVICAIFVILALLSKNWAVAAVALVLIVAGGINLLKLRGDEETVQNSAPQDGKSGAGEADLRHRFECWLDRRGVPNPNGAKCAGSAVTSRPYPVFIIAAEGGGIYAASAASTFLARMQDDVPGFSEHVFAISGVSGGAIGATIFQALDRSAVKDVREPEADGHAEPCPTSPARGGSPKLEPKVAEIMLGDNFSPVVAAIFPQFLGTSKGRARALEASFAYSACSQDPAAAQALGDKFIDDWRNESRAPALVLNTTWVETGFRVAFAPFTLHEFDDSLYSFSDKGMPYLPGVSLIEAAVASARFPGILPPFSIMVKNSRNETMRWNFVDGGYSDNSGATTALALYDTLKDIGGNRIDLRLILITSSDPQPPLDKIDGTAFRDTLAPIDAVMKVREGRGNEAVAQVCNSVLGKKSRSGANVKINCMGPADEKLPNLSIVEIEDQSYGLPLGWNLSHTTYEVVSWMLGRGSECDRSKTAVPVLSDSTTSSEGTRQINSTSHYRNSCTQQAIADVLEVHPAKK